MEESINEYPGEDIDVTWDEKRCIHSAECVEGAPEVFDTDRSPWVDPDNGDVQKIANVVERCPTGALQYDRKDGGSKEDIPKKNVINVGKNGPLYLRGNIRMVNQEGDVLLEDTRVALCRCGESNNKPLCDNTHTDIDFEAESKVDDNESEFESFDIEKGDILEVVVRNDGPNILEGKFEIRGGDNDSVYYGENTALCRCGKSGDKPFCNGTHSEVDFSSKV